MPNARYEKVLEAFGGNGYYCNTPDEIQKAMKESMANTKQASMVNVMIDPMADRRAQVGVFIGKNLTFYYTANLSVCVCVLKGKESSNSKCVFLARYI